MVSGRAIARGVATVTGARFLGLVLTLIQVKMTVTYLGPTAYGLLVTATLFVNSFGAWTDMGMGNVVVRRVSGRGESVERVVGLAMSISLMVMAPLFVAMNVAGWLMYRDTPIVVVGVGLLSIGFLASSWLTCYNPIAQVTGRFGHFAAADLIGRLLSISIIALGIHFQAELPLFFVAQLMVPVAQMLAMMRFGRLIGRFRPLFKWAEMKALALETLPMTYITAVGVLYFSIDGVMLSKLSTPEMVGAYGLAYKIAANFTIVSASLASVMTGRFAADSAISARHMATSIRAALRLILVVAVPLATLVFPLAPDLVRFVGSEEMVPIASLPLALVSVGVAIGMLTAIMSTALIVDYQQRTLTILNTFNLLLNIGLNFALIPRYGAAGAAMSLIVSELSGLIVCLLLMTRRYKNCIPWPAILRMVPVIAVAWAVEMPLQGQPWWLRVLAVGLTYFVCLFAFQVVSVREVRQLLRRDDPCPPESSSDGPPTEPERGDASRGAQQQSANTESP